MHLDLETRVNFESTTENYTEVTDMNKDGAHGFLHVSSALLLLRFLGLWIYGFLQV